MSRLIQLYPRAWRDRYEGEFLDLLRERPPTARDRFDIVRGALDAQLHPHALAGGPEPAPWTHRLPGLLALSAGLALTAALLGIAFGPGPDWGAAESFFGAAIALMLISLPGDYLATFGRRIGLGLCFVVVSLMAAPMTDWWAPVVGLAIIAELVIVCGLLVMASVRAGIGARRRWLVLAIGVLVPLLAIGAHAALRALTGIVLVADGSSLGALALLPYGLAWLIVGLWMAIRGSATIVDPPTDRIPASEVHPA